MGEFEKRLREELFGFKPESLNNDKSTLETVIEEAKKEFYELFKYPELGDGWFEQRTRKVIEKWFGDE